MTSEEPGKLEERRYQDGDELLFSEPIYTARDDLRSNDKVNTHFCGIYFDPKVFLQKLNP